MTDLGAAFLAEVGVVALQQLAFDELRQRVLQRRVLHRHVQRVEDLLALVPVGGMTSQRKQAVGVRKKLSMTSSHFDHMATVRRLSRNDVITRGVGLNICVTAVTTHGDCALPVVTCADSPCRFSGRKTRPRTSS